jgi:anti-sigma regulatory factor (Ser/Thr protein kinase)
MGDGRTLVVTTRHGAPTYTCTLPRAKESANRARFVVTALLDRWGLALLADDAVLVMDELVANAAAHACGASIRITVVRKDRALVRLAVVDLNRNEPTLRSASLEDEGGRGLYLVAGLSLRWGVDPFTWGKRVWAEVGAR